MFIELETGWIGDSSMCYLRKNSVTGDRMQFYWKTKKNRVEENWESVGNKAVQKLPIVPALVVE